MKYMNFDTGEVWTEEEIKEVYEAEYELHEQYPTFEEYLEHLIDLGKQKVGGIVEINYIVRRVGGENDGEMIGAFDDETDAIVFAREYDEDHAEEDDYIGVGIYTADGMEVENWI